MDRREFARGASTGALAAGTVAAGLLAGPAAAQQDATRWRLQSAFPRSLKKFYELFDHSLARMSTATEGKFVVQGFGPGELVPVPSMLSAISNGTIAAGFTAGYFYTGIDKSFAMVTGIPFGTNSRIHAAWYEFGGGKEVLQELFDKHNLVHFMGGNTGSQMGGFFRKPIKSVQDLHGLKMRVAGLGGEVLASMGVVPQQIPPGEFYTALEKGTLDAAEFTVPNQDEQLGLHKVAPYYHTLGFWDYSSSQSFWVNKDSWKELPAAYKEVFTTSVASMSSDLQPQSDALNMDPLRRMVAHGVKITAMPRSVLDRAYEAAFDLYAAEAGKNPLFKKIYTHWSAFREKAYRWYGVNETVMDQYILAQVSKGRR